MILDRKRYRRLFFHQKVSNGIDCILMAFSTNEVGELCVFSPFAVLDFYPVINKTGD